MLLRALFCRKSEEWISSVVLLLSGLQLIEINPLVIHHGCVYPCDAVWSVFSHLTQEGYGSKERIVYIPNGNWVFVLWGAFLSSSGKEPMKKAVSILLEEDT